MAPSRRSRSLTRSGSADTTRCSASEVRYELGARRAHRHDDRARAPVVGFVASGGARMQEGVAALGGYGRIFRRIVLLSGRVPQISVVTGVSAGGGAYSPALTDWVVMTEESSMFLTGPAVVRDVLGEDVSPDQLGGTRVHDRNGVCQFVTRSDLDAAYLARELLGYLPSHRDVPAPPVP